MGLFGNKKVDWSQMIPDPPAYTLANGSAENYLAGIEQLLSTFQNRANGTDMFDYLKFLFEPQKAELSKQYGIDVDPNDVYSQNSGVLPQTLASMNKRGLLDTGTSGVIEGQTRSDYANQVAKLFGESKQLQRNDIDNSLNALGQLFPARFNVANIPNQVNYSNAMNNYNALLNRNQATVAQQQSSMPWYQTVLQAGGNAAGNFFGAGNIGTDLFGNGQTSGSYGNTGGFFNSKPTTASSSQSKGLAEWFDQNQGNSFTSSSRVNSKTPGFSSMFGGY
jgi:hypothetical protein